MVLMEVTISNNIQLVPTYRAFSYTFYILLMENRFTVGTHHSHTLYGSPI